MGLSGSFWRDKRVLLTGHTGFKGAWMALWLDLLGATVTGFSLSPPSKPSMYELLAPWDHGRSYVGDVRDEQALRRTVEEAAPQVVMHFAAQPLVRVSYKDPVETFSTNVMGTVLLLDRLRFVESLEAVIVVTTDKVYESSASPRPHAESDPLGISDPYSSSKVLQELATQTFAQCYFEPWGKPVATVRAGNVIGGGDWAEDRVVPDLVRSIERSEPLVLRSPNATRPWQHVLDPLNGYLLYAERLAQGQDLPRALNFGPTHSYTVSELVRGLSNRLGVADSWSVMHDNVALERSELELDSSSALRELGWKPQLGFDGMLRLTADWYKGYFDGEDLRALSVRQISEFIEMAA